MTTFRGIADDSPPSIRRLRGLHANAVRMVARQNLGSSFSYDYARFHSAGIATIPVLTSDSFLTDNYAAETRLYVYRCPDVPIWLVGNEWNITGDASWPVGEDALVDLWNKVAPNLPSGSRYLGGYFMVDAAPSFLYSVLQRLTPRPDGVDLHPYLDTTPTFAETTHFLQEAGYQVSVCEWNDTDPKSLKRFQRLMDDLGIAASMFIPWIRGSVDLPGLASPRTGKLLARGVALRDAYTLTTGS